jgi:hypothetical protein
VRTQRWLVGLAVGTLLMFVVGILVRGAAQMPWEQEPQGEVLPARKPGRRIVSDVLIIVQEKTAKAGRAGK